MSRNRLQRSGSKRRGAVCVGVFALNAVAGVAAAQTPSSPVTLLPSAAQTPDEQEPEVESLNDSDGYTPPDEGSGAKSALSINGYVDVGFAHAQGNGTSFAPVSVDTRLPADYGVDTFAPAVNSRGDVASTFSDGRFVNGFLPRSVGIGGRPSALVNTLAVDFKYDASGAPVTIFSRVHFLPRFSQQGDDSRVFVEQAFGRIVPFESQEMALSVGKFDSVFGIEYLDNQANIRTGITPSLIARYTTGQSIGAKLFYRIQIAPLWSALTLNAAVTNGGTFVESLQGPDISLAGAPVGTGRLGYELNTPVVQVKLGASASYGPRNDQPDPELKQKLYGADLRVAVAGMVYVNSEYVIVDQDGGRGFKTTPLGNFPFASEFHARGGYVQLAIGPPLSAGPLRKVTAYGRYGRRHAWFEGIAPITVDRITAGLRVDLWESVILKGEYLMNRELEGAPTVENNVLTSSLVFSW